MKRTTLLILAGLVCASAPVAIKHALAQKTDAPPQADRLDFPIGDWNCAGNLMAMGKKPGHATTGHAHSEKILDGNWIAIHYDEVQTSANAQPYHVIQYIGYDRAKNQFVSVAVDNTGPNYSTGRSSGWKDDVLTLDETDSTGGKAVVFRDTFTRTGSEQLTHTGTMQDKDKKWVKTDEETCHRS